MTDLCNWKWYVKLSQYGNVLEPVNYSQNFANPTTGAHTNQIVGTWTHVRNGLLRSWVEEGQKKLVHGPEQVRLVNRRDYSPLYSPQLSVYVNYFCIDVNVQLIYLDINIQLFNSLLTRVCEVDTASDKA